MTPNVARQPWTGIARAAAYATVLLTALLGAGCSGPTLRRAARSDAGDYVRVQVSARQVSAQSPVVGKEARVAIWIANRGDWPVLVRGVTPSRRADLVVSLVDWHPGHAVYDAKADTVQIEAPRTQRDVSAVHHGLLFPGEALRVYTSAVPLAEGPAYHRFRVDYVSAPWEELREHLYLANRSGASPDTFRRRVTPPAGAYDPRLRRAILADGHHELFRGASAVRVALGPAKAGPFPLDDACRLAAVDPASAPIVYSDALGGWVFGRDRAVVLVRGGGEMTTLTGVDMAAVRAIDRHRGPIPIVFGDAESSRKLADLVIDPKPSRGDDAETTIASGKGLALLRAVSDNGLQLTTAYTPPTLTVRDPCARPLLAYRSAPHRPDLSPSP